MLQELKDTCPLRCTAQGYRAFTRFIGLQFDTSSSPELKVHKGHSRLGTRHSQSLSALDQHQGFGAVDRVVTER
eukprot:8168295-Pyramimonas_sp.AAC.2